MSTTATIEEPVAATRENRTAAETLITWAIDHGVADDRWPKRTREVFALLRGIGYDANRHRLDYHLLQGHMTAPPKEQGEFQWSEADVAAFTKRLEAGRNWLPHPLHDGKLTPDERMRQIRVVHSEEVMHGALRRLTVMQLIDLLAGTSDQENRSAIAAVLRHKLHLSRQGDVPCPETT